MSPPYSRGIRPPGDDEGEALVVWVFFGYLLVLIVGLCLKSMRHGLPW